jgi:hypothetical protein
MTRDDIIRLAREALKHDPGFAAWTLSTPHLEIIVNMAIKIEREACAKVAEAYEPRCDTCPSGVATAIRARGV